MQPYTPPAGPLRILGATDDWVLVDKPTGLLSVPGRGTEKADCLEARLASQFGAVFTVHRLDMETSGVMVFARTLSAQSALSGAFRERRAEKAYEALVHGEVEGECGEVDLPLIRDWPNRPRQKVCRETGKPSLTRWEVTGRHPSHTRVRLTPHTGRSHQLRVHMMALAHPILGDSLYASPEACAAAPRLMLHACVLRVFDRRGRPVFSISSPSPF